MANPYTHLQYISEDKKVTITLENEEYPILMPSFDIEADHENIIVNRILPMINEEGL
ncbi:MAG: hypothetical protein ACR2IS_15440 [Nitrososphaeraceae archaeon]